MLTGMLGAQFPAPTLQFKEGDEVYLTLTNVGMIMRPDLFDPHTVHWHGFPNASSVFDGEPMASISINMGSSITYYYKVVEPGTFMYHCHVEATEHMQMGMLGNLYVTPAQDNGPAIVNPPGSGRTFSQFAYNDGDGSTGYNVAYPVQIQGFDGNFHDQHILVQPLPFAEMYDTYPMFNGRGYPDTMNPADLANSFDGQLSQPAPTIITASSGQRILLRFSSLSTVAFHSLTVQGIPMKVIGKDSRQLRNPYLTNTVTLGGGESLDVLLDTAGLDGLVSTADDVPAGTYYLYTTNLDFLANNEEDYGGMMTEIVLQ
jgi:FtsP/CotA-like multicopper oxidase with cupredoxin domain